MKYYLIDIENEGAIVDFDSNDMGFAGTDERGAYWTEKDDFDYWTEVADSITAMEDAGVNTCELMVNEYDDFIDMAEEMGVL